MKREINILNQTEDILLDEVALENLASLTSRELKALPKLFYAFNILISQSLSGTL